MSWYCRLEPMIVLYRFLLALRNHLSYGVGFDIGDTAFVAGTDYCDFWYYLIV